MRDRLGRENLPPSPFGLWRDKPGGGAFALGLCSRRRYSPPRACAHGSASPKARIPSRSTLPTFQTGSKQVDRPAWIAIFEAHNIFHGSFRIVLPPDAGTKYRTEIARRRGGAIST